MRVAALSVCMALAVALCAVPVAAEWRERWSANATAKFFGLPIFSYDKVFICADARVLALDSNTGRELWNNTVETACQYADTGRDRVYVGSNNAVTAFDIETGKRVWQYNFTGSGVPAKPTFAADRVLFVVENGSNSTRFTALDWSTGAVAFQASSLATSRIWYTAGLLVYVEQQSATNTATSLVARNATDPAYAVIWRLPSTTAFPVSTLTGFEGAPILVMLSFASSTGISVLNPYYPNVQENVLFSADTNNFDFTSGRDHFFTIESYGAPQFANSTLSAFRLGLSWAVNVTLGVPNLAPAPGKGLDSYILAQGAQAIMAFDEYTGKLAFNRAFPNPQQIIGQSRPGEYVIGNAVESKIYLFEY